MKYKNPKISRLNSIQDISLVPLASIFSRRIVSRGPKPKSKIHFPKIQTPSKKHCGTSRTNFPPGAVSNQEPHRSVNQPEANQKPDQKPKISRLKSSQTIPEPPRTPERHAESDSSVDSQKSISANSRSTASAAVTGTRNQMNESVEEKLPCFIT